MGHDVMRPAYQGGHELLAGQQSTCGGEAGEEHACDHGGGELQRCEGRHLIQPADGHHHEGGRSQGDQLVDGREERAGRPARRGQEEARGENDGETDAGDGNS